MPFAALLNGNARRVTPEVVRALRDALPGATVLVSADFAEARRHVRALIRERPEVVLSGGGDGAAMRLLTWWRDEGGGALPALGILRLGTGNGWARALGAPAFFSHLRRLAALTTAALPISEATLVEVEDHLCPFAGVGWDARILNDYQRNLEKRRARAGQGRMGAFLHQGVRGYLYAVARITIPEEWMRLRRYGQARMVLENAGDQVFTLDARGRPAAGGGKGPLPLYEGPVSVGAASTVPEWGYGFRAFPFAGSKPGFINVRIWSGQLFQTVRSAARLWRGDWPLPGMHDFFATAVRMRFSRPMPFQIGGDAMGEREEIVLRASRDTVRVVDWRRALAR